MMYIWFTFVMQMEQEWVKILLKQNQAPLFSYEVIYKYLFIVEYPCA